MPTSRPTCLISNASHTRSSTRRKSGATKNLHSSPPDASSPKKKNSQNRPISSSPVSPSRNDPPASCGPVFPILFRPLQTALRERVAQDKESIIAQPGIKDTTTSRCQFFLQCALRNIPHPSTTASVFPQPDRLRTHLGGGRLRINLLLGTELRQKDIRRVEEGERGRRRVSLGQGRPYCIPILTARTAGRGILRTGVQVHRLQAGSGSSSPQDGQKQREIPQPGQDRDTNPKPH